MTDRSARFTDGSITRHTLSMAGSTGLGLLAFFLVDILTIIYISRLGDPVLVATVGVAKTLAFLNMASCSGVTVAAGVIVSRRIGRHAAAARGRLVASFILLSLLAASLMAAFELLGTYTFTAWLQVDGEGAGTMHQFVWAALVTCVPNAAVQTFSQILRANGDVQAALFVPLAGALVLAVADPVLIFGLDMGIQGAAISIGMSSLLTFGFGLLLVKRHVGIALPSVRRFWLHCRVAFKVAIPATLSNLATPVALTYLMSILGSYGASTMAGMTVIDRLVQLGFCFYFALPSALVPILGQNLGAKRLDRAGQTMIVAMQTVVLYGLFLWGMALAIGPLATFNVFHLADSGAAMLEMFYGVGVGIWIVFGLDFIAQSVFLTTDRLRWVPIFSWLRGTLGTFPFVYAGAQVAEGTGALLGLWIGQATVALCSITTAIFVWRRFVRVQRTAWL